MSFSPEARKSICAAFREIIAQRYPGVRGDVVWEDDGTDDESDDADARLAASAEGGRRV